MCSPRVSRLDFVVVNVASAIGSGCALPELIAEARTRKQRDASDPEQPIDNRINHSAHSELKRVVSSELVGMDA